MAPASAADLNIAATNGPPKKVPVPDLQKSAGQEIGFLSPPKLEFASKEEERDYVKGRLAGAYRIFGYYGLNEGLAGHITARDPIDPNTFWVNPFGVDFNLITRSDLLRVDHKGTVLDHGKDHVVFEGKGIVLAEDEGCDIAAALGDKKAALLRNHGLLTVGQTIEEAINWFYLLDKCCHVNLLADAAAHGRGTGTVKISDEEAEYTRGVAGSHKAGWMGGNSMFGLIDELSGKKYLL